ncbi:uncharacterized protein LOC131312135 isoform X1 [Rhododendron vialii]|uniref:uncharacterized protein LOC131312135 isoform X1 n=1 Tax=Rhododendron vialii TaxID=182163 RepID=UPI00265F9A26|nr:uncharacterized protein LOC131312135 isoform X1 [Rhododendron vialii]
MALTLSPRTPPTTMYVQSTHQHHAAFPNRNTTNSNNRNFLPPIHLHRSTPPSASNPCRCRAVSPGRQPPPESEPPNGKDPSPSEGCKTPYRSSLQFFFGCLCSSGLQYGMEGITMGRARDLDFEDELVRTYSFLLFYKELGGQCDSICT